MLPISALGVDYTVVQQINDWNDVQFLLPDHIERDVLRIFVCEFVTGGGLYRDALPSALMREGEMMRDVLLRDLAEISTVSVVVTLDARLRQPEHVGDCVTVSSEGDIWATWQSVIASVDAVWLVAPEAGGILTRLSRMVEAQGKVLLGADAHSVEIATSKSRTAALLARQHIPVVPVYPLPEWQQVNVAPYVVKPDDGVDCEDTFYVETTSALKGWMAERAASVDAGQFIVQPYVSGTPASISMLCRHGRAWLLSCNRQYIACHMDGLLGKFSYEGGELNGMLDHAECFQQIASAVASSLPGLSGYVGIDVIVDAQGAVQVLEVNPRLTTSFVGMRDATGVNPARLVLELFYNEDFICPPLSTNTVEVLVHA